MKKTSELVIPSTDPESSWKGSIKVHSYIDRPLWFHKLGLSQTASGYGKKLTSRCMAMFENGDVRRLYITQYSNIGTGWVMIDGEKILVS